MVHKSDTISKGNRVRRTMGGEFRRGSQSINNPMNNNWTLTFRDTYNNGWDNKGHVLCDNNDHPC